MRSAIRMGIAERKLHKEKAGYRFVLFVRQVLISALLLMNTVRATDTSAL